MTKVSESLVGGFFDDGVFLEVLLRLPALGPLGPANEDTYTDGEGREAHHRGDSGFLELVLGGRSRGEDELYLVDFLVHEVSFRRVDSSKWLFFARTRSPQIETWGPPAHL